MARLLVIEIEHLPYEELSPNARLHWSKVAAFRKVAREEIGWLAKAKWGQQPAMDLAELRYQFNLPDKRCRDVDNLIASCKAFQDGLIDAGVIVYDDAQHLKLAPPVVTFGTQARTYIYLKEVSRV